VIRPIDGPAAAPEASAISCRLARSSEERAAYFALRRAIFCDEQKLFAADDADALDAIAHPIVCLWRASGEALVVGVVRIWETAPGDFWGGRLGVDAAFRRQATVGRRLVQTAVGTARGWGAWRFRATVQRANVAFFRRLRWRTLDEIDVLGQPHHLMEADLQAYPPVAEPRRAAAAELAEAFDAA
jgi:putative N-acetyltransferase (TIGR04045 family)